jgi:hypothetical protein
MRNRESGIGGAAAPASIAFLAALALLGAAAAAEDTTVSFAPNCKEAEALQGASKSSMTLFLTTGKENEEAVSLAVGREEEWTFRVLAASKGLPSKAEKEIRRSVEVRESPMLGGKCEQPDFAAGKTFEIDVEEGAPRAVISAPESERGTEIPAALRKALEDEFRMAWTASFPAGPVARDAAWTREGKDLEPLLRHLGLGSPAEGKGEFRIAEVVVKDAALCARVEIALSGVKIREAGGMEAVFEGKGTILFLLDEGRIAKASLKGDVRTSDPATGLSGKGTFELSFEQKKG